MLYYSSTLTADMRRQQQQREIELLFQETAPTQAIFHIFLQGYSCDFSLWRW